MDIWGMYSPDPCSHHLWEAQHNKASLLATGGGHRKHLTPRKQRDPKAQPTAWVRMRWVPHMSRSRHADPLGR